MTVHRVRPGDSLASIAETYRFPNWKTVWDAEENASLRDKRPNPEVLLPGDEVFIPEKRRRDESAQSSKKTRFRIKRAPWILRLAIKDELGEPIANEPYELEIPGAAPREGETDGDGLIEEPVPPTVESATLWILGDELRLGVGDLDPVSAATGVQQRLNNLGHAAGVVDGKIGRRTTAALLAFQRQEGLPASGELDDETRQRLLAVHDNDDRVPGEAEAGDAAALGEGEDLKDADPDANEVPSGEDEEGGPGELDRGEGEQESADPSDVLELGGEDPEPVDPPEGEFDDGDDDDEEVA